jgi:translation initiation factor IF-2
MVDNPKPESTPETQPAFSGGPPKPPKKTARDLEDWPDDAGKKIHITDPVVIKDLVSAVGKKPFKIVADVLELGQFKNYAETIDFETASKIALKHGYTAERITPA